MKNNEWWDSERGMGGIGGKKDEKPEWREDQPTMIKNEHIQNRRNQENWWKPMKNRRK